MTEKEEFCQQIRLWENAMYALAYSIVRNEADASEVLSESVYRAYKNFDKLNNKKAFKSWILKIVHNTSVELIRKNANFVPMEEVESGMSHTESDITTRITLKREIEKLPQPYRTVIILFYYENLSILEIARVTGAHGAAVRKQLSRARKMLKEMLKEDFVE